jgi:Ca2+-binding RTX toxin-like protein
MHLRTRLAVYTGAALFTAGWLVAGGVATASTVPPAAATVSCDGLAPTIVVPAPNMVTFGTVNADVILGTSGNDVIHGLEDDDSICAGDGQDNITGGPGNDRGFGEGGDDNWRGGNGADFFDGGPHVEGDRGDGGNGMNNCVNTEIVNNC